MTTSEQIQQQVNNKCQIHILKFAVKILKKNLPVNCISNIYVTVVSERQLKKRFRFCLV